MTNRPMGMTKPHNQTLPLMFYSIDTANKSISLKIRNGPKPKPKSKGPIEAHARIDLLQLLPLPSGTLLLFGNHGLRLESAPTPSYIGKNPHTADGLLNLAMPIPSSPPSSPSSPSSIIYHLHSPYRYGLSVLTNLSLSYSKCQRCKERKVRRTPLSPQDKSLTSAYCMFPYIPQPTGTCHSFCILSIV